MAAARINAVWALGLLGSPSIDRRRPPVLARAAARASTRPESASRGRSA